MKLKFISLMLAVMLLVITLCGCNSSDNRIDGNQWLEIQEVCMTDLESFCEGMDEVYTLYIIGSISPQDFVNEIALLNTQYGYLIAAYDQLKADNPLKPESHSYLSKQGTEAMENIYLTIKQTLDYSLDSEGNAKSIDEIAYLYLAQRQQLIGYISEYSTALSWLRAANGEWNETGVNIASMDEIVFDIKDDNTKVTDSTE